jgi:hypothetical protein
MTLDAFSPLSDLRVIFSELYIAQGMLGYRVKKGFETFDIRISAIYSPHGEVRSGVDYFHSRFAP